MLEIYRTRSWIFGQRFKWRLVAENNEIVAASSEGFYDKAGADENAKLTLKMLKEHFHGEIT